ncbi:MAG: hypothetical protein WBO23_06790 [Burkholderiales bacterium]
MSAEKASDEVIDAIAYIEMQRQDMEKQSNPGAACNLALRKLQEVLQQEQQAAQQEAPDARHSANVEALENEIRRVKQMLGGAGRNSKPGGPRPGGLQPQHRDKGHRQARNRGRRTQGRPGGR